MAALVTTHQKRKKIVRQHVNAYLANILILEARSHLIKDHDWVLAHFTAGNFALLR